METISTILIVVTVIALWGTPIFFGVRIAKKKNLSPHWMWFGIHPFFGWIAFAILAATKPKKACINCGEVLKAHAKVCAYCNTTFDDSTIPQPVKSQSTSKKKSPILGILIGIGAFFIFAFFVFSLVTKLFTNSWAYRSSLELAMNNSEITSILGEPIKQKGFMAGSINTSGNSGTADLLIPIRGPEGKGKLSVYAEKTDGKWEILNLVFEDKNSTTRIRLLE